MWLYVVRCGGLYLENLSSCNLFCEVDTVTSFSPLHNSILEVRCVRRCPRYVCDLFEAIFTHKYDPQRFKFQSAFIMH